MPWLVRDGEVIASLDVARSMRDRRRGLLGRSGIDGALMITPAYAVHTVGMRFDIDVIFLDRDLQVVDVVTMPRRRIGRPRLRARSVIEAEAGFARRHCVSVGDVLEVENTRA